MRTVVAQDSGGPRRPCRVMSTNNLLTVLAAARELDDRNFALREGLCALVPFAKSAEEALAALVAEREGGARAEPGAETVRAPARESKR